MKSPILHILIFLALTGNSISQNNFYQYGYDVYWDASAYPSGVYFYRMVVADNTSNGSFTQTKKMVLIK